MRLVAKNVFYVAMSGFVGFTYAVFGGGNLSHLVAAQQYRNYDVFSQHRGKTGVTKIAVGDHY